METSSRSSALVGLCATGGAVAVLTSAGLVPAIGLAFGLGGGWLLGQKLKSKTQKPQAFGAHRSTCCGGGWWWVRMPQLRMDLLKMMLFTFPFIQHLRGIILLLLGCRLRPSHSQWKLKMKRMRNKRRPSKSSVNSWAPRWVKTCGYCRH